MIHGKSFPAQSRKELLPFGHQVLAEEPDVKRAAEGGMRKRPALFEPSICSEQRPTEVCSSRSHGSNAVAPTTQQNCRGVAQVGLLPRVAGVGDGDETV